MSSVGSFILVKNEAQFIGAHLKMWLPHLSEMVLFDGNSTDGTTEIISDVINKHPLGHKVKLFTDKDPKNLQEDYVRMFNEALQAVDSDLAFFLHPDMIPSKVPANFDHLRDAVAASVRIRSFGGEPGVSLFEMSGRGTRWKSILRRRNPDLGAHYSGHYGAQNEDIYFSEITGESHEHYGVNFEKYPYTVADSWIDVMHFSDVRTYSRRYGRMVECLKNQGRNPDEIPDIAAAHPRVTLKDGSGFKFVPAEYPQEMIEANAAYAHLRKENDKTPCHA